MPRRLVNDVPYSLDFTAANSLVSCGTDAIGIGAVSICAWIKPRSFGGNDRGRIIENGGQIFFINNYSGPGNVLSFTSDGLTTAHSAQNAIVLNNWTFVSVVRNSSNAATIYINGVRSGVAGQTTGIPTVNTPMYIGNRPANDRAFDGKISRVQVYNRELSQTEIISIMNSGTPSGLMRLYKLSDGSGATATDSSTNAVNATIANCSWSTDTTVSPRVAVSNRLLARDMKASLALRGYGNTVATPSGVMTSTTAFTFGMFVMPNELGAFKHVVSAHAETNSGGFYIRADASVFTPAIYNGATAQSLTGYKFRVGVWYYVALRLSGGTADFFVDGTKVSTLGSTTMTAFTGVIRIGGSAALENNFNMQIADVSFFDGTALSDAQIAQLPNGLVPGASLLYKCDEGSGSTVNDTSGNSKHGTISAGTFVLDTPTKKRKLVNDNLVYNGDFEYAPPGTLANNSNWIVGASSGSTTNKLFGWFACLVAGTAGSCMFDKTVSHSGAASMKLSTTNSSTRIKATTCTSVYNGTTPVSSDPLTPVLPSTSYTASFWVKTDNINATNSTFIIRQISADMSVGGSTVTSIAGGTNGWTQMTSVFTTASTARYVMIELNQSTAVSGTATMWFDDIELRPTVPTARGVVA